jgi:hypothetical protein
MQHQRVGPEQLSELRFFASVVTRAIEEVTLPEQLKPAVQAARIRAAQRVRESSKMNT